ncbi:MFS transporter [Kitasatospora sp. NPDC085895]|uniref:MFS transporter n=1 Tax=Kitasatospora sp. NPDC085895 TaxID=3155057 RepID=UPI00344DF1EC
MTLDDTAHRSAAGAAHAPPGPSAAAGPPESGGVWRRMGLWGAAHAVDDFYQGLVPAVVPYFALDRGYDYVAVGGLAMAATVGSAVPQPFVGLAVDRWRLGGAAALGVALAGVGLGAAGLVSSYAAVWLLVLLSGLGVAMFHPAAGRSAREAAGGSTTAMSVFAAGGSVGFFLAPVLATPVLAAWGVRSTVLFVPPALITGWVLLRHRQRQRERERAVATAAAAPAGPDRWPPFLVLTGVEVARSVVFFGVSTFLELHWLRDLHASHALAGAALAGFLGGGVAGTLLGGRLADRIGAVAAVRLGTAATVPALAGLCLAPGGLLPLLFAVLTGAALNVPFAVMVKLGQDYLPGRPGTAAGVTLGLGVSAGGLCGPLLGLLARAHGPQGVLAALCAVPLLGLLLAYALVEPGAAGRAGRFGGRFRPRGRA